MRVIDQDGKQLGILSRTEALSLAAKQELDLVEISPNANPPVAKIVDWGKYSYQKTKQQQKNKRNTKVLDVKQMRFGLKISDHDMQVKLKKVSDWLDVGHKVKLVLIYRGREMAHKELGYNLANKIIGNFNEGIIVEHSPQLLGKQLSFTIRSDNHAKVKNA